jgi:hypothetical protein
MNQRLPKDKGESGGTRFRPGGEFRCPWPGSAPGAEPLHAEIGTLEAGEAKVEVV